MSFYKSNRLLTLALTLSATFVFAQKPREIHSFEIKLPAENESWRMDGNMRISEKTGFPAAIYQANFQATPADAETMAREFIQKKAQLLGLTPDMIQSLQLHKAAKRPTGHTVRFRQFWKGLPVNKNAELTIHITPNNVVDFVMNGLEYGISLSDISPAITADAAKQSVMSRINVAGNIDFQASTLEVLHHQSSDNLVYRVVIVTDSPAGEWEAYVDAESGAMLKLEDISDYHHHEPAEVSVPPAPFRLLTTVNGTGNIFNPDPLSSANAVYGATGFSDASDANSAQLTAQVQSVTLLDITETAGTYSLVGPYADIRDFEAPNKGLFTQASSAFAFLRNPDAFEAVNCYYHIDNMMRYLNTTLGITCLPYQYVGGVQYDPSGLNGADNSHYISATGRVAFGEGGVDDAEDADVVIHELGHGIHDWITSGGLSQVNGLSEGCGDYWAASYSRFLGQWPSGNAAYNWVFNWDGHNPFWGGRIVNYGAIYPGGLTGAIHTDGQIWATAMMHIWDDIGRVKSDKIFWSGLDNTNSSTNQNDAANAVYQAAITLGCTFTELTQIHTRFTAAGYTLPALPLPVELTRFSGQKSGDEALLTWTVAQERDNDYFTIERSADGQHFDYAGQVKSEGNTTVPRNYSFADKRPFSDVNYYRLKQTDLDGKTTQSSVVTVDMGDARYLDIFPNPAGESITIKNSFAEGSVTLIDATGKIVLSKNISNGSKTGNNTLMISHLPEGMYWVKLIADNQVLEGKLYKK